jgi:hypothetical protein
MVVCLGLLLLANCDLLIRPPAGSNVTVEANAGGGAQTSSGPGSATLTVENQETGGIAAAEGQATSNGLGGTSFVSLGLRGSNTSATATGEHKICLVATHADAPDVFLQQSHRIEVSCAGDGGVTLTGRVLVTKNDEAPIAILDGSAAIDCGDPAVASSGFPPWFASIPVRFFSGGFSTLPDIFALQIGDRVVVEIDLSAQASLAAGAGPEIEVTSTISPSFDFGVEPVDCTPGECGHECLDEGGGFCDHGTCHQLLFGEFPDFSGAITPSPATAGQLVSVRAQFDVQRDNVLPFSATFTIPSGVATIPPFPAPGHVVGGCDVGPVQVLLVATGPSTFRVETPSEADPTGAITQTPSGDTEVTLSFPFAPNVLTVPDDATIVCNLNTSLVYRGDGTISGEVVSVDVTSPDGMDDGVGLDPIRLPIALIVDGSTLRPSSDRDGDGTPDDQDACPDDPFKVAPGICPCGIPDTDSDGDGASDCLDDCPEDPQKILPGICGCRVSEVDSDGDRAPDCVDQCPDDPNKTQPGPCGCGVSEEADGDGDGVRDCDDECPLDPGKTQRGHCGCGVSEAVRGTPCDTGQPGICGPGRFACALGAAFCVPLLSPTQEACNLVDDDCDQAVDEGNPGGGARCDTGRLGVCSEGTELCTDGRLECFPRRNPSDEVCNGLDDDCNGLTDEGDPCPAPQSFKGLLNIGPNGPAVVTMRAEVTRAVFDPPADGLTLRMEQDGSEVVTLHIPPGDGWKQNKQGTRSSFVDRKDGSLGPPSKDAAVVACPPEKSKKQTCSVVVNAKNATLGAVTVGTITTTIVIGEDRFQHTSSWKRQGTGKKTKLVPE